MITSDLLKAIAPSTPSRLRDRFIEPLNRFCPQYGIDNYLRICAFLATGGIESDYFKVLTEYASGNDYEGRRDLGNTQRGDGARFKGRGFFQTTGRSNYKRLNQTIGAKYKIDFLAAPEKMTDIFIAVESACIFWRDNNLSKYADGADFKNVSSIVNCGRAGQAPNQWAKRNALYSLCKRRIPADFSFSVPARLTGESAAVPPQVAPNDDSAQPTTFKEIGTTVFLHTPKDTIKNILVVISTRVLAGLVTLWGLGLHGRIFLVALALVTSVAVVYACIKYAPRLLNWSKQGLDYIFS